MKIENATKIFHQVKEVKDSLPKLTITGGRVTEIQKRIKILKEAMEADGDTLVTLNILTTVAEVPTSAAIALLEAAYKQELELAAMYEWRLEKALEFLQGEHDAEFLNDR